MRKLMVVMVVAAACGAPPKSDGIRSTINVIPKGPPELMGGYEFELLDAVEGQACVEPTDQNVNWASIPGFEPYRGDNTMERAESAALYDAMTKTSGADSLLVTWVQMNTSGTKRCAKVHARGVRLRQAGTPVTPAPTDAPIPPAPSPPQSGGPAPAAPQPPAS